MALANLLQQLVPIWPMLLWLVMAASIFHVTYRKIATGLAKYPGPFWASITDTWRLFMVLRGRPQEEQRELHNHYGDVVRLGPRTLSFANPQAVTDIYSGKNRMRKVSKSLSAVGRKLGATDFALPKESIPCLPRI
jgi:hypothetical protein